MHNVEALVFGTSLSRRGNYYGLLDMLYTSYSFQLIFFLQLCQILINILENKYENLCIYNYIFSSNIVVLSKWCIYHIKGPRIRVSYNHVQENTGVTREADGIPIYWGKKQQSG